MRWQSTRRKWPSANARDRCRPTSVSSTDNVGVTKVAIYIDGALVANTASFTWNLRKVSLGAHTIFAKAYDAAGNVGTSATITVNVVEAPKGSR